MMERTSSQTEHDVRRVLVIAYYFPPMGLSGVQRVAKFVKYLSRYGWRPTVLSVKPAGYFAYDSSLADEVVSEPGVSIHRTSSVDPTRLFGRRRVVALPRESHRRFFSELSQWVFLPDNKIGWLPHAVREGARILKDEEYGAIVSSAPPYTGHLIGSALARRFGIPLLLDYRDDWLDNPRHVYPTRIHRRVHELMERWCASAASDIITINPVIAQALQDRLGRPVAVLEQGFDPADFAPGVGPDPSTFTLTYTGIFYDAQKPDVFLKACRRFLELRPEARAHLRIAFAGTLPYTAVQLATDLGLAEALQLHGYLPHAEAVRVQQRSDVLWLTIGRREGAESISTGKLFEYIGARRPILALVPHGAAADLLKEYNLATICDPERPDQVAAALVQLYENWASKREIAADEHFVRRFDRTNLTFRLANRLTNIALPRRVAAPTYDS